MANIARVALVATARIDVVFFDLEPANIHVETLLAKPRVRAVVDIVRIPVAASSASLMTGQRPSSFLLQFLHVSKLVNLMEVKECLGVLLLDAKEVDDLSGPVHLVGNHLVHELLDALDCLLGLWVKDLRHVHIFRLILGLDGTLHLLLLQVVEVHYCFLVQLWEVRGLLHSV